MFKGKVDLDPMVLIRNVVIGGIVGAVGGGGLAVFKSASSKRQPSGKDLDPAPLNFDEAAPDLIPLFQEIDEFSDYVANNYLDDWRKQYGAAVQAADRMLNIQLQADHGEIEPSIKDVAEIEVHARNTMTHLHNLALYLPSSGSELRDTFKAKTDEINEAVQNLWINFKNGV